MKKKKRFRHKIGYHGAVGWVTPEGTICAECGKPIKEEGEIRR